MPSAAAKTQEARKEAAIAEFQEKKAQLRQYSDDTGHFSLVRFVLCSSPCVRPSARPPRSLRKLRAPVTR